MIINNKLKKDIIEWRKHYEFITSLDAVIFHKCHHIPLSCICIERDGIEIILELSKLIEENYK